MSRYADNSGSDLWSQYTRILTDTDQSLSERERAEVLVRLIREGNRITDVQYSGHRIADHSDFVEQKALANELFEDLSRGYSDTSDSVFHRFLEDADQDYVATLAQTTRVASSYNEHAPSLDSYLRFWFIPTFYSSVYELACKVLTRIVENLFSRENLTCGDARQLMIEMLDGKYRQIAECFDNFLRNAIDHSQYIFNDQTFSIDAWNIEDGRKTPRRRYQLDDIFSKTVKLLFLIVALYVVFNEKLEAALVHQYNIT